MEFWILGILLFFFLYHHQVKSEAQGPISTFAIPFSTQECEQHFTKLSTIVKKTIHVEKTFQNGPIFQENSEE